MNSGSPKLKHNSIRRPPEHFFRTPPPALLGRVTQKPARTKQTLEVWGLGDIPIVLLRISDPEKLGLAQELIQAHSYWQIKGFRWTWLC